MALDRDELNKRREAREADRKKRKRARILMRIRLILAVIVLIGCGVGIYYMVGNTGGPVVSVEATLPEVEVTEAPTEAPTEALADREQPPVKIQLVAGGDLNVTDQVVWSGQEGGEFDYTKAFMDVAPILSEADLALLNF